MYAVTDGFSGLSSGFGEIGPGHISLFIICAEFQEVMELSQLSEEEWEQLLMICKNERFRKESNLSVQVRLSKSKLKIMWLKESF
jgi:hypothetical protein